MISSISITFLRTNRPSYDIFHFHHLFEDKPPDENTYYQVNNKPNDPNYLPGIHFDLRLTLSGFDLNNLISESKLAADEKQKSWMKEVNIEEIFYFLQATYSINK